MRSPEDAALVAGLLCAGFAICGFFFLRFWSRTRDGLFLAFAVGFWLLAANQAAPILFATLQESVADVYLLRLAAFVVIIAAVLGKNVRHRR